MKILVYSSVFYPGVGGIENLALFLSQEFIKAGHEVKVITEQVQDKNKPLDFEVVHSRNILGQIRLFFWCDVMFMPNITLKGIWLKCLNPFKPWVISHNDFHMVLFHNFKSKLKLFVIRFATRNISVCKAVAKVLPVKCTVIYNGYSENMFKIYPDEDRKFDIVFSGRLVKQKGCDKLIEACKGLDIPFTLNVIGDGPELDALKTQVKEAGLENQIHFLGFRHNEELARLFNNHKVMVIPSQYIEGFPLTALEGLASGCKMIVSDSGGLPEAVDGFGKVFEMEDTATLTRLLGEALKDNSTAPMTDTLKSYLEAHTKKKVAGKYLEVFSEAIA